MEIDLTIVLAPSASSLLRSFVEIKKPRIGAQTTDEMIAQSGFAQNLLKN
jgi:hypothetical protein